MEPIRVDTRDTMWEEETPRYRVQMWTIADDGALSLEEFEFTDVEVDVPLRWAAEHEQPGITAVVYARLLNHNLEPGLIRLLGTDPSIDR
jgi:hypothetical protein